MLDAPQIGPEQLANLGERELRELTARLLARIEQHTHEIDWRDAKLEKLAYEIAHLRRMKFSARSEQLNARQKALFDESVDADIGKGTANTRRSPFASIRRWGVAARGAAAVSRCREPCGWAAA